MAETHSDPNITGVGPEGSRRWRGRGHSAAKGYRARTHPTGGEIHLLNFSPPNLAQNLWSSARYLSARPSDSSNTPVPVSRPEDHRHTAAPIGLPSVGRHQDRAQHYCPRGAVGTTRSGVNADVMLSRYPVLMLPEPPRTAGPEHPTRPRGRASVKACSAASRRACHLSASPRKSSPRSCESSVALPRRW